MHVILDSPPYTDDWTGIDGVWYRRYSEHAKKAGRQISVDFFFFHYKKNRRAPPSHSIWHFAHIFYDLVSFFIAQVMSVCTSESFYMAFRTYILRFSEFLHCLLIAIYQNLSFVKYVC